MDAAQIAAMIADREAGTPGSWSVFVDDSGDRWTGWPLSVNCDVIADKTIVRTGGMWPYEWDAKTSQHEACANARRIARVPDMEAAIIAQAAELERLREAMGNNCNALTDADCAYLIAHLSYELEPVGKPPTWNQLAIEVIRLSNALALKGGAA